MNKALKPRINSQKKAHRQPLAAHIPGFSIRVNKKNATKRIRKMVKNKYQAKASI